MYELSSGESRVITLRSIWTEYKSTRKLKESTINAYDYHLHQYVKEWLDIPIGSINKSMVMAKHRALTERNGAGKRGGTTANYALKVVGYMLSFAASVYDIETLKPNPVQILSTIQAWNEEAPRTRRLEVHQLPQFFSGLSKLRSHTVRDLLIFMTLTSMRIGASSRMKWEYVDLDNKRVIKVPARYMKNGMEFEMPLSTQLHLLLSRRKRLDNVFVFGGREHGTFIKSPGGINRAIDLTQLEWTPHDLRRTFINVALDRLSIEHDIIKRLASHRVDIDITSIYGGNVVERLRGPMQQISDYLLEAGNFDLARMLPKDNTCDPV